MRGLREECGVFGIYNRDNLDVATLTYLALHTLQHRGQESAGIAVSDGKDIDHYKAAGLVTEVFDARALKTLKKKLIALGHVRYATSGAIGAASAQPFVSQMFDGQLAFAHNGHILNAAPLRNRLLMNGAVLQTEVDSEIITHLIAQNARFGLEESIMRALRPLRGAYSLAMIKGDKLIAVRDPLGMRPLSLGKLGDSHVVASETCALDAIGATLVRNIEPGEVLIIDKNGLTSLRHAPRGKSNMCVFEYVYLARTDSVIEGLGVYDARVKMGMKLAANAPVEADLVAGVPDSALPASKGYSLASGIEHGTALVKSPYVGRTFIKPSQVERELSVKMKLSALGQTVRGKRLVLVDDSIVRGTTSRYIVEQLRHAGAKEVHMRVSSPPVVCPCYFGIDTPSPRHLINHTHTVEQICKIIGADSLAYLSLEDLLDSVSEANCGFCAACFDGKYPMDIASVRRVAE